MKALTTTAENPFLAVINAKEMASVVPIRYSRKAIVWPKQGSTICSEYDGVPDGEQGGIAIILEVIEKTLERKGSFSFCGVSPTVAKTFQIMGLLQLSRIYATEEDALQAQKG